MAKKKLILNSCVTLLVLKVEILQLCGKGVISIYRINLRKDVSLLSSLLHTCYVLPSLTSSFSPNEPLPPS